MPRISETQVTCTACGNVSYYGKSEALQEAGKAMQNAGKDMMCCTGCGPAAFIPNQQVRDLNKCPRCGSGAIKKQIVEHTVS